MANAEKNGPVTDAEFFAKVREHVAADPVASFLDAVSGRVMEAAEEVNRRIGPLDDRAYAAVVTVLADSAVRQIAVSLERRASERVDEPECEIGCTCIMCIPGA